MKDIYGKSFKVRNFTLVELLMRARKATQKTEKGKQRRFPLWLLLQKKQKQRKLQRV